MKGKLSIFLILAFLVAALFPAGAFAEEPIRVNVDGKAVNFDTQPQIMDGRTMVPLRGILEAMGMELKWDAQSRTITAQNKDYTIILPVDSRVAIVNGKTVMLDVPAKVVEGRTMVPARFISESAGAEVNWDAATKTVNITKADNSKNTNNTNNISDINNSTVSVNNTNIDNSVKDSNNTTNNYNYSTTINNNITQNITINMMNEDLLKKILAKLEGTDLVPTETKTEDKGKDSEDTVVKQTDVPVIIPLERQPDEEWRDGVLTYNELMKENLRIAVVLPKGLNTGSYDDNTGLNRGHVKYIELLDENKEHLGGFPSPIEKMELEKGVAVYPIDVSIFSKVRDGETCYLKASIRTDDKPAENFSELVSFKFKDEPGAHVKMDEVHITSIRTISSDKELFWAFQHPVDFSFAIQKFQSTRPVTLAWRKCTEAATMDFVLRAEGEPDVMVVRSGFCMNGRGVMSYAVAILEPEKIKKGVKYSLVPVNQNPDARWVVDEGVYYVAQ